MSGRYEGDVICGSAVYITAVAWTLRSNQI